MSVFCIGLTGNIASGKTTVAAEFKKLGIDVINADQIAKTLTLKGQPALTEIVNHFGEAILTPKGELDRHQLREKIFNHEAKRQWLEALLHPLIRKQIEQDIKICHSPYCLIEIPLLPDKSDYPYLNRILFVTADREHQILRLIARDHSSRENALKILAIQASKKQHLAIADDVLMNNGSLEELQRNIAKLHEKYLCYAQYQFDKL